MTQTIRYIARSITDSSRPLADRAALAKWARTTAWAWQIEQCVLCMAADQAFACRCRN